MGHDTRAGLRPVGGLGLGRDIEGGLTCEWVLLTGMGDHLCGGAMDRMASEIPMFCWKGMNPD